MRNAFADELHKIGAINERVVFLSGDIGNRLFDDFKQDYPTRFFNCGIAEANMIGVAAGMAKRGFRPIAYTITPFVTYRCFEQIRVDLCYNNVPVIFVGVGSGLSYGELGPTHHSCEDIGALRTLPNLTVLCPGDAMELRSAMREALTLTSPCFIRIGKKGEKSFHTSPPPLKIGQAFEMKVGLDVCLLPVGNMLEFAFQLSDSLGQLGISTTIASYHTVKPLDTSYLRQAFHKHRLVVSLEEHTLMGGFGSAIAEWKVDNDIPGRLYRVGTQDQFLKRVAHQKEARIELGIELNAVVKTVVQKLSL